MHGPLRHPTFGWNGEQQHNRSQSMNNMNKRLLNLTLPYDPGSIFAERNRLILADRAAGMSFRDLGQKYGLTTERCAQLCRDPMVSVRQWRRRIAHLRRCLADPASRRGGFEAVPGWQADLEKAREQLQKAMQRARMATDKKARKKTLREQRERFIANCPYFTIAKRRFNGFSDIPPPAYSLRTSTSR
jgi:hypothetical protein